MIRKLFFLLVSLSWFCYVNTNGQTHTNDSIPEMSLNNQLQEFQYIQGHDLVLFSFVLNSTKIYSSDTGFRFVDSTNQFHFHDQLAVFFRRDTLNTNILKYDLTFSNLSEDTLVLENIIPLNDSIADCYITAEGPWSLARTKLYRKGKLPLGVILPDNAWELGYSSMNITTDTSIAVLTRRTEAENCNNRRYKTHIFPKGSVSYSYNIEKYKGDWQAGLIKIFQQNYLYDLVSFEDSLYSRKDLGWIRGKYLMALQFAWDHEFYDPYGSGYKFEDFLKKGISHCGGYDIFGIWPTWPSLGLDQRNQWDLYKDLPGGLDKLNELSSLAKSYNTRFFIAYNPWDQSTREEDPYKGMAQLIKDIDADGVILDTRGNSSYQLQRTADSVKKGIIMYSEGMAIPKDMPGIISGRVHDAIFMPPELNLNKLIKPDFSIFRVCQLSQGRIHREVALSLFNGYGIELNTFAPGRPDWKDEELNYLGKAVKILRENSGAFNSKKWIPLIPTLVDNIWVNKFPGKTKTIYTVYSLRPEGFNSPLFEVSSNNNHFVSLWNHEELTTIDKGGKKFIPVITDPFNSSYLETRREGSVDCIASFPSLLKISTTPDSLFINVRKGDEIRIWSGDPSYQNTYVSKKPGELKLRILDLFNSVEEKLVIQLMGNNELMDERIIKFNPGTPRLISELIRTPLAEEIPNEMVEIPGGAVYLNRINPDSFIPYPAFDTNSPIVFKSFYMDQFPVTNNQFYDFIESTGYKPKDNANFLKHWTNGKYPRSAKNEPVVYVSYEDAQAYAEWAGKRLPTEAEWQYSGQGTDNRIFPWGNEFDSTHCNTGNDFLTPVNKFPEGASPFGVMDMVGNIWQLTNDVYDNGSYYYIMIRGGSYYNPSSSWWYVKGGPQQLNKTQMLLRVSQGFERNATVGFRCVMDKK